MIFSNQFAAHGPAEGFPLSLMDGLIQSEGP
jgi:hypothetical protein